MDDELSAREYVTDLLEFEGHDVLAAADGRAALQCIAESRPDFVLLDSMMPGMSGQEVLAEIRRIDGGPRLPVVMLTAAASDEQAWQAWSAGADYFLVKPLDADKLTRVLHYLTASGEHVDQVATAAERSTLAVAEQPSMPTSVLDEEARLRALARYAILDSQPDRAFDDLRSLAQGLTNSAVAAIAFFDRDRVWFKSQAGFDVTDCPREVLLEPGSSTLKLHPAGPFGELAASGRVASTPCVTSDGYTLGCLIVADHAARSLRPDESAQLEALARQIVRLLELRRTLLAALRSVLHADGLLALGYQLRQNMPAMAQTRFPAAGYRLYEAEHDVTAVALAAGFGSVTHLVKGTTEAPEGRVMLATQ